MEITLTNVGKRFNFEWIFRNIGLELKPDNPYAVIGANGSGKSTFLKIISGHLTPSEGKIIFNGSGINNDVAEIFQHVAFAAPYIDLIDDFTLMEALQFHFSFKKIRNQYSISDLINISGLEKHKNKSLKLFSSGMKQRVKLIITILSDTAILLLDEPTTNLDADGVAWYINLVEKNLNDRIVVCGSNIEREYTFAKSHIQIADFKTVIT